MCKGYTSDPIYAAIAAKRLSWAQYLNECDLVAHVVGAEKMETTDKACRADSGATSRIAQTKPTTLFGLYDVLRFVAEHEQGTDFFYDEDEVFVFLKTLASAAGDLVADDCMKRAARNVATRDKAAIARAGL